MPTNADPWKRITEVREWLEHTRYKKELKSALIIDLSMLFHNLSSPWKWIFWSLLSKLGLWWEHGGQKLGERRIGLQLQKILVKLTITKSSIGAQKRPQSNEKHENTRFCSDKFPTRKQTFCISTWPVKVWKFWCKIDATSISLIYLALVF